MSFIALSKTIEAPAATVFSAVADMENFSKVLPHIVNYEFLTETKTGIGTRFRETRLMNGQELTTELEITEYIENDRVRFVADTNGTLWNTLFTVRSVADGTTLDVTMDVESNKVIAKLMSGFIKRMVRKAVEKDLDLVKTYCESEAP